MALRHPSAEKLLKEERQEDDRKAERETNRALAESVRDAVLVMAGKPMPSTMEADVAVPSDKTRLVSENQTTEMPDAPLYVSDKPQQPVKPTRKRRRSKK